MIRKLLLVAAAIAMPASAGAVALVGTASPAGAVTPVTCSVTGIVHFAAPGLTKAGSVTTATTESTTTTGGVLAGAGCGTTHAGTLPNQNIKSATTPCTGTGLPVSNPACVSGKKGYDSWANYVSGGTSSILTSLPNVSFKVGATTYTAHNTAAAALLPNAAGCGTGTTAPNGKEVGFKITGKITTAGAYLNAVSTLKVCLGKVTGTGLITTAPATVPTFFANLGKTGNKVVTSTIDAAHSSLTF